MVEGADEIQKHALDSFNQGWIEFEQGQAGSRKGVVSIDTVLQGLIERARMMH